MTATENKLMLILQEIQRELKEALAEVTKVEECKRLLELSNLESRNDCDCLPFKKFLDLKDSDCPSPEYLSKFSYSELSVTKIELTKRLEYFQKLQEKTQSENKLMPVLQEIQQGQKEALAEVTKAEECKRLLELSNLESRNDCDCLPFKNSLDLKDSDCPSPEYLSKFSYSELSATKIELTKRLEYFQKLQKLQELEESLNYFDELFTFIFKPFIDPYWWVDLILDMEEFLRAWVFYIISNPYETLVISISLSVIYLLKEYKQGKYR